MTLLEKLMEKRSSQGEALADIFRPKLDLPNNKPIVRNSIIRGDSGQHHLMRKGEMLENVRRVKKTTKKQSETSIRRLLGLFGADN